MSAPDRNGPFRRDARVERSAECAPAPIAWDVIMRGGGLGLRLPAYLGLIGVATVGMALGLPGRPVHAGIVGVGIVALGIWIHVYLRRARARSTEGASALPRRCAFTADGMILEGTHGRSEWVYGAIRTIRRHGPWLAIELRGNQRLVVRADAPGDAQLAEWLAARAPGLEHDASSSQRTLLLLAILYALLAAAAVTVLPGVVAP